MKEASKVKDDEPVPDSQFEIKSGREQMMGAYNLAYQSQGDAPSQEERINSINVCGLSQEARL